MQSGSSQSSQSEKYARSRSLLTRVVVISTAIALIGVAGVIIYGYTARRAEWVGVSNKDFWDYLRLLIVPTAIAFGVAVLDWMQSERARKAEILQEASEREAEVAMREHERKAEENRREREREAQAAQRERELEVESQRAQDEAFQAYLDQISKLLLDKQRPLQESQEGEVVRTVARARTLTALTRLDGSRRRSVLQFLYESGLVIKDRAVIDLKGADLSEAQLSGADLLDADLSAANLYEANLSEAELLRAHLNSATLHRADLRGGDLREAKLLRANLHEATMSRVDLRSADLREANLHKADLSGADLSEAQLSGADLREATLSETNLSGANLEGALGIAHEELQQQAYPLDGATMPNGQKYENWIKTSEDGHGKDEENSGLS